MKIKDKLIVFDYGGIIEGTPADCGYSYHDCIADAIMYATGMRPNAKSLSEFCEELYQSYSSSAATKQLWITGDDEIKTRSVLGNWLYELNGNKGSTVLLAERYLSFIRARYSKIPYDKSVITLQKALSKECMIAAMTNISWYWSARFRELTADIPYDFIWESFRYGCMKPDDMSYRQIENVSGVSGENILLFDDRDDNVKAAIDSGWCAYKVTSDNKALNMRIVAHQFLTGDSEAMPFLTSYPV